MTLYVSKTTQVISVAGVSALFEAGVPRPLRESLVGAALAAGVREAPEEEKAEPRKKAPRKAPVADESPAPAGEGEG